MHLTASEKINTKTDSFGVDFFGLENTSNRSEIDSKSIDRIDFNSKPIQIDPKVTQNEFIELISIQINSNASDRI